MFVDIWECLRMSENIWLCPKISKYFNFIYMRISNFFNDIYVKKNEISYIVEIEEKGEKAKMADISE